MIGDAAIAGAMPKSAFAANAQAKVCAEAVAQLLAGAAPAEPRLINTCYSLVAPGYGDLGRRRLPAGERPAHRHRGRRRHQPARRAAPSQRAQEAEYADAWFKTITGESVRLMRCALLLALRRCSPRADAMPHRRRR